MQVFQSYCTHVFCNIFTFSLLNPCYVNTLSLGTQFSFTAAALNNFVVLKKFLFKQLLSCFGLNSSDEYSYFVYELLFSVRFIFWSIKKNIHIFPKSTGPIISLFITPIITQRNVWQEWNHFFYVLKCKIKFRVLWEHMFYYYRHTISIIWMNIIYNKPF